jgi:hypothetical protein
MHATRLFSCKRILEELNMVMTLGGDGLVRSFATLERAESAKEGLHNSFCTPCDSTKSITYKRRATGKVSYAEVP